MPAGGGPRHGTLHLSCSILRTICQQLQDTSMETCISLTRLCGEERALSNGKLVHAHMIESGYETDKYQANVLVEMYCKCGATVEAEAVFSRMHQRDPFSYNVIIAAYAREGNDKEAICLFQLMRSHGVQPNKFTFVSILCVCVNDSAICVGHWTHTHIVMLAYELDVVVSTALLNMYSKCSMLQEAKMMFDNMDSRNVVAWTAMIGAYAQNCEGRNALLHFDLMQQQAELPNKVTFVALLDACARLEAYIDGMQLLARVVDTEIETDVVVGTALVNMFANLGDLSEARKTFDKIPARNVISWNAMLAAYAHHGEGQAAFELFSEMQELRVHPDKATFVSVFDACASSMALQEGVNTHAQVMEYGFESDSVLATAIVYMYGKCGSLREAHQVFDAIADRNAVSCNSMLAAYAQHGHCEEAIQLVQQMYVAGMVPDKVTFVTILDACIAISGVAEGQHFHAQAVCRGFVSDITVSTALIKFYGKSALLKVAEDLFHNLPEKSVVTWGAMIAAYAQNSQGKQALDLFKTMYENKMRPDEIVLVSAIDACASLAAVDEGEQLHNEVVISGYESGLIVATALVNMYGSCGNLQASQRVFDRMSSRSVVSWNAIIAAYAQHGQGKEVMGLLHQMHSERVRPNEITFLSVLNSFSHAGLVKDGLGFFQTMIQDRGITATTDHYTCLIDLLARAGLLQDAEDLIFEMPHQPTIASWVTLLGACDRGERASMSLLEPEDAVPSGCLTSKKLLSRKVT